MEQLSQESTRHTARQCRCSSAVTPDEDCQLPRVMCFRIAVDNAQRAMLTCGNSDNVLQDSMLQIFSHVINSRCRNTSLSLQTLLNVTGMSPALFHNLEFPLGAIAQLLNARSLFMAQHLPLLQRFVRILLDANFTMRRGLSPLTAFIFMLTADDYNYSDVRVDIFIEFLIVNGAHVAQQMLRIFYAPLQELKVRLSLPDVLVAAHETGNVRAIRQLLPYWGYPGLCLMGFLRSNNSCTKISKLFPVLIEHGGLPHGTRVYKEVVSHFSFSSPRQLIFQHMHSSPLSLRELCRYQIRVSLIPRASMYGNNMPDLVASLSPPGLLDFLQMRPVDLNVAPCGNVHLMQAAHECDVDSNNSDENDDYPDFYEDQYFNDMYEPYQEDF